MTFFFLSQNTVGFSNVRTFYFFTVLNKAFNLAEKGDDGINKLS